MVLTASLDYWHHTLNGESGAQVSAKRRQLIVQRLRDPQLLSIAPGWVRCMPTCE